MVCGKYMFAAPWFWSYADCTSKISASREQQKKERDREERENGYEDNADYDDDEMDM
jgi:hypothetical protein